MSNSPYKMDKEFAKKLHEEIHIKGLGGSFSYGEEEKTKAKPIKNPQSSHHGQSRTAVPTPVEIKFEDSPGFQITLKQIQEARQNKTRSINRGFNCGCGCGCLALCVLAGLVGGGVVVSHLAHRTGKTPTQPAIKQQIKETNKKNELKQSHKPQCVVPAESFNLAFHKSRSLEYR